MRLAYVLIVAGDNPSRVAIWPWVSPRAIHWSVSTSRGARPYGSARDGRFSSRWNRGTSRSHRKEPPAATTLRARAAVPWLDCLVTQPPPPARITPRQLGARAHPGV